MVIILIGLAESVITREMNFEVDSRKFKINKIDTSTTELHGNKHGLNIWLWYHVYDMPEVDARESDIIKALFGINNER